MDDIKKLYGDGVHDDTENLQKMLDECGEVSVPDGKYLISKPLIVHDNTHIRASKNAHFYLADHANCSLLDNDGLYKRCTNHNITIEGGIWDGNNMMQERQVIQDENVACVYDEYIENKLAVFMIRLVHTRNLVIKDVTFKDPTSFGIHIADVEYFRIENVTLDYNLKKLNMDGVHIQGPARFGYIYNVFGDATDDHIALCANGTTRSEITRGPIENIEIKGVYCNNGYTGVRLLSSGDPVRNINISNIHGRFRIFAVSFTHHYPLDKDRPILIENVHVSDVYASKAEVSTAGEFKNYVTDGPLFYVEGNVNCNNVLIEKVYRNETCKEVKGPTLRVCKGATLTDFTLRDCYEGNPDSRYETIVNETDWEIKR